jgi:hypothetical protein
MDENITADFNGAVDVAAISRTAPDTFAPTTSRTPPAYCAATIASRSTPLACITPLTPLVSWSEDVALVAQPSASEL